MSSTEKKELGQFYTKNAEYIVGNLLSIFPSTATIVDPFAGEGDLIRLLPFSVIEEYDIDPKRGTTIRQDTLLNPPNYKSKWILTNPPYLARNKTKNKMLFNKYQLDDLYKISIKTIIGCKGGVLIVPINFFSCRDGSVRNQFLNNYRVIKVNVFEEQIFSDTTYTICSFSFVEKSFAEVSSSVSFTFFPSLENKDIQISEENSYIIGNEIYNLPKGRVRVSRLLKDKESSGYISNIKLYAIDSGSNKGRIRLEYEPDHFYGKSTDRGFATLVFSEELTHSEELSIIWKFNENLEKYRERYHSLFLTNFRNSTVSYARKRIDFDLAYRIISNLLVANLKNPFELD